MWGNKAACYRSNSSVEAHSVWMSVLARTLHVFFVSAFAHAYFGLLSVGMLHTQHDSSENNNT